MPKRKTGAAKKKDRQKQHQLVRSHAFHDGIVLDVGLPMSQHVYFVKILRSFKPLVVYRGSAAEGCRSTCPRRHATRRCCVIPAAPSSATGLSVTSATRHRRPRAVLSAAPQSKHQKWRAMRAGLEHMQTLQCHMPRYMVPMYALTSVLLR
jgi:hypothetical protein